MRKDLQAVFERKTWSGRSDAPRSGHGSTLKATARLRDALPGIFETCKVRTLVDAPCGDWTWMQAVDLDGIDYVGADIAESLIDANRAEHGAGNVRFEVLDITSSRLPACDLFMCRECLFHLKFWLRWAFFENFARSEGRYLLTSIDHVAQNDRLQNNGQFKRFNPCKPPFNLPAPLAIFPENHDGAPDMDALEGQGRLRSMGLWSIAQVRQAVADRPHTVDA